MKEWKELDSQTQIYLYWEYCAANSETEISFSEFEEMIQGITFE